MKIPEEIKFLMDRFAQPAMVVSNSGQVLGTSPQLASAELKQVVVLNQQNQPIELAKNWQSASKVSWQGMTTDCEIVDFGDQKIIFLPDFRSDSTEIFSVSLENLVKNIPGLVYRCELLEDGSLSILYASDETYDIFGVTAKELKDDRTLLASMVHSDDVNSLMDSVQKSAANLSAFQWVGRIKDKSGRTKIIEAKSQPSRSVTGTVIWDGVIFDKTAENRLKEELDKHRQIATHSARLAAIGELAAGIGHEINNPLAGLIGQIQILQKKHRAGILDDQMIDKQLSKQLKSADRIKKIVESLRKFSTMRETESMNGSATSALQSSLELTEDIFKNEKINVTIENNSEDHRISCDTTLLQQVLLNLLTNARDALANVKQKRVSLKIEDQQNGVQISISDNGCGIAPENLDKIFNSFFTTKSINSGTGIGLYISNSIVEASGGKITVESKPRKGTTFTMIIPYLGSPSPEEDSLPLTNQPKELNVLIVDDEPYIRDYLKTALELRGFLVQVANNGVEALNKIERELFDVLITDIKMPKMNGMELLETMNQKGIGTKVRKIVMTGAKNHDMDTNNKEQYGEIQGYIEKPLNQKVLEKMILDKNQQD